MQTLSAFDKFAITSLFVFCKEMCGELLNIFYFNTFSNYHLFKFCNFVPRNHVRLLFAISYFAPKEFSKCDNSNRVTIKRTIIIDDFDK